MKEDNKTEDKGEAPVSTYGAFIANAVYLAPESDAALATFSEKLSHIPVGLQDTSVQAEAIIQKEISPEDIAQASKEVRKAHHSAVRAQSARVSRRLLMTERSKKLTVVCPETGIVSLLEVPAIPYKALVYQHPLAELQNARGIAQQGFSYLKNLDTQVLAGILIVLAETYELFRFQPYDSGAQKNALLRTAGKELLISAILLIEHQVHSRNQTYLPKLSLVFDPFIENKGVEGRLAGYMTLLAEAIEKPDLERYDENAKPKKIGRPLYIRDVEKQENKLKALARHEISKAKKEFDSDKKAGKILISELFTAGKISQKMKSFVSQLLTEDALLVVASDLIDMLVSQKLSLIHDDKITKLTEILKKPRKLLTMDVAEVEKLLQTVNPELADSEASELTEIEELADLAEAQQQEAQEAPVVQEVPNPPEGLTSIQKILWIKKWKESQK
jgi:hypothetical protein